MFELKMCEKYMGIGRDLYEAFIYLQKANEVYGIVGKLLKAVKSFYKEGKACVRMGRKEEYFPVKVDERLEQVAKFLY